MFRIGNPSRRLLAVFVLALALLVVAQTAVLATTLSKKGGAVTQVKTVTNNDSDTSSSTAFVDMPGMSTSVSVPSGQKALLVVTFSAQSACYGTDTLYCFIRVQVGGSAAPPGDSVLASAQSSGNSYYGLASASMQFVAGPLAAGTYTVKVQWRVDEPGGTFRVENRTLTVLRSKV